MSVRSADCSDCSASLLFLQAAPSMFPEADMSTKLKLMGVDVASFGNAFPDPNESVALAQTDAFEGLYKKLFFSKVRE
eukprot:9226832-Pyramimonas_sp.AAC.1